MTIRPPVVGEYILLLDNPWNSGNDDFTGHCCIARVSNHNIPSRDLWGTFSTPCGWKYCVVHHGKTWLSIGNQVIVVQQLETFANADGQHF